MTAEHVLIHYTGGDEKVPLRDRDELAGILRERRTYHSYEIKQSWWYRPVVWFRIQKSALLPRH
jgi:hypothetical protein